MADGTTRRPGSGFFAITFVLLMLSLTVLGYGLLHKSSVPQILGRYSISYAILLTGIVLVVVLLGMVLWRQTPVLIRWAGNVYAFLISALIALGLAEAGLRVFRPWGIEYFHTLPYHMQGMVDHPQLGYVHPKSVSYELGTNRVELNSHGLRDEEVLYAKEPDERRVLVLGDSVTFGWGVNQGKTFSDRMEPLLSAETGNKWQVINAGVNGYNSEQEATYLRIEGMQYSPDIVILVYVDNDIDAVFDPNVTTWRRYPNWPESFPQLLERLRSLSYLYQLTWLFSRMQDVDEHAGGGIPSTYPASVTSRSGWPASRAALKEIKNQCKKAQIPFLVAKQNGNDPAFFAELSESGIEAIALTLAEAEVPADQRHVSRIDPHPSEAVHAMYAKYLVDALHVRGWLEH